MGDSRFDCLKRLNTFKVILLDCILQNYVIMNTLGSKPEIYKFPTLYANDIT